MIMLSLILQLELLSDLSPLLIVRCFLSCCASIDWMCRPVGHGVEIQSGSTFDSWSCWDCGVSHPFLARFAVDRTIVLSWLLQVRTIPPLCLHCFAWRPKMVSVIITWGLLLGCVLVKSRPSLQLILWPLLAGFGYCLWLDFYLTDGVWAFSDLLLGVRYNPLPKNSSIKSYNVNNYLPPNYYIIGYFLTSLCTSVYLISESSKTSSFVWCNFHSANFHSLSLALAMAPKEKNKPKNSFKNTLLNQCDAESAHETKQNGPPINPNLFPLMGKVQKTNNKEISLVADSSSVKAIQGESDKSKGRMDAASFISKLTKEDVVANQYYIQEFNKESELAAAEANLFFFQEDGNGNWSDGQDDCLAEHQSFIDEMLVDNLCCEDLPILKQEENSFHSLNSDNPMLKHLAEMELKKAGQSASGSGKRKNFGGDGDTASSDMVGTKKPKI